MAWYSMLSKDSVRLLHTKREAEQLSTKIHVQNYFKGAHIYTLHSKHKVPERHI